MPENARSVTTRSDLMRRLAAPFGLVLVLLIGFLAAKHLTFSPGVRYPHPSATHSPIPVKSQSGHAYDPLIRPSPNQADAFAVYRYDSPGFAPKQAPRSPLPCLIPALLPFLASRRPRRSHERNTTTTTPPRPPRPKQIYAYDRDSNPSAQVRYYGYRYFDPVTGRWPSRDPIGETGGINLYGMVANDAIGSWDYLGLKCYLLIEGSIVTKKGQYGYDMYKKMVDAAKRAGYEVRENAEAKDLTETQSDKACTEIILITHGHETGEITIPHKGKKLYPTPERAFNKRLKKGNMNKLTIRLSCCYWDKVCDPETTEKMKKDDIELKPVEVPQVIEEGEEGQIIQRDSFRKTAEYLEKLPAKNTQND